MSGQRYWYRVLIVSLAYALELTQQCSLHRSMYVFHRERYPLWVIFFPSASQTASSKPTKGNVPPLFHCFDKFLITLQNPEIILIFHLINTSCVRKPCSMVAWSLRCLPLGSIRSAVYRRCRCRRKVYSLAWCSHPFSRCPCWGWHAKQERRGCWYEFLEVRWWISYVRVYYNFPTNSF